MPIDKVSKQRPDSADAYDYSSTTSHTDVSEGVVKTGTREWDVPCHRIRYTCDGGTYTVVKIGDEFESGPLPDIAYKQERNRYRSNARISLFLFAGFMGYLAIINPNPTFLPVSILIGLFLGLTAGSVSNAAYDLERTMPQMPIEAAINATIPGAVIFAAATPLIFAQPTGYLGYAIPDSATGAAVVLTLFFGLTAHFGNISITTPHKFFEEERPYEWTILLTPIVIGAVIGYFLNPFAHISFLGVFAIWLIGAILTFLIGGNEL